MYDIESMKRREQEKNDISEQLKKRFSLNQYLENVKPKLTLVSTFEKVLVVFGNSDK